MLIGLFMAVTSAEAAKLPEKVKHAEKDQKALCLAQDIKPKRDLKADRLPFSEDCPKRDLRIEIKFITALSISGNSKVLMKEP